MNPAGGRVGTSCFPGGIDTMIDRFSMYRRRRVLPFLAVYALVFINGATLAPLAVPAAKSSSASRFADDAHAQCDADAWRWLEYQRGSGPEQGPEIAAALPPIVKNLRRHTPSEQAKAGCASNEQRPGDARIPGTEFMQRALAANNADLNRLCRLLL